MLLRLTLKKRFVKINKKYALRDLIKALQKFSDSENYPITFEYGLIKGVNTSKEDAKALARLLRGLKYKLNLIPINYSISRFCLPDEKEVVSFTRELEKQGLFFTIRKSRGQDIKAACGQLRSA